MDATRSLPGSMGVNVAEGSVLFVSVHIDADHRNYGIYRPTIDSPPDFDLNRLIETTGTWARKFFHPEIVDAPGAMPAFPTSPNGLSAVVMAASLHYWSNARGKLAPWQDQVIQFAKKSILEWNLGFLGLCGGAQIGLRALGGGVEPNPPGFGLASNSLEDGVVVRTSELVLTGNGRADPIFSGCPSRFGVLEAHGDYLARVPEGVKVLANSHDLPNQVLGWGDRVRLFQPHPEMSLTLIRRILRAHGSQSRSVSEATRFRQVSKGLRETHIANERIVANFLRML